MATVVLSEDGRVEIPADMRAKLFIKAGAKLNASVEDGALHLRPVPSPAKGPVGPAVDLTPWLGAGTGLFGSMEEIDDYIRKERDSWD